MVFSLGGWGLHFSFGRAGRVVRSVSWVELAVDALDCGVGAFDPPEQEAQVRAVVRWSPEQTVHCWEEARLGA